MALTMPLGVIGCSHTTSSPGSGPADPPSRDACVPALKHVFFGMLDGGSVCRATQSLECGLPTSVHVLDGGCSIRSSDCKAVCPSYGALDCQLADASCSGGHSKSQAPVSVTCDFCPNGIGRRPADLVEPAPRSASALPAFFERVAFLEAASVRAFGELGAELASLGAPAALVAEIRSAATDEARHLLATARLARRFGGRAPPSTRTSSTTERANRSLDDVARDNAVEGCVRETYGALVACFQSRKAEDAAVRETMVAISRDETRHAALSWAIFRWAASRTAAGATADALGEAIAELHRGVTEPHGDLVRTAGLPTAAEQRRLLRQLERDVWS